MLYSIFSISFSQEEQIQDFLHLLRIRSLKTGRPVCDVVLQAARAGALETCPHEKLKSGAICILGFHLTCNVVGGNNNNNNNCLKSNIQKVQWTIINDIHI